MKVANLLCFQIVHMYLYVCERGDPSLEVMVAVDPGPRGKKNVEVYCRL